MPTQYGFRKGHSTLDPIYITRRVQDILESAGCPGAFLFLDWSKAFDSVYQPAILEALKRYSVPPKLVSLVGALYNSPHFNVELNSITSSDHPQNRGIRQGCPLSPYLFVVVMSALFADIHNNHPDLNNHRIWGTNFTELLYADDTLLLSRSLRSCQTLLHAVEHAAARIGLHLNRDKTCLLFMNGAGTIHYADGSPVATADSTTYLGCNINTSADVNSEISSRISQTVVTWRRLAPFWKRSEATFKQKLIVYNAVIRAKLLYGMSSIRLLPHQATRLNSFLMRGLRQILGLQSTWGQMVFGSSRTHTNDFVLGRANHIMRTPPSPCPKSWSPPKPFRAYSDQIFLSAGKLYGHVVRAPRNDPMRRVTFRPHSVTPKFHYMRRVGRPRDHWTDVVAQDLWSSCCHCPTFIPDQPWLQDPFFESNNPLHNRELFDFMTSRQF